jgi:hypothetical protein
MERAIAIANNNGRTKFQRLLNAAREGDNGARGRLYVDYGPHFRRVILKRLRALRIEWATTPHDSVIWRVWQEEALDWLGSEEEFLKYVSRAAEREVLNLRRHLTAGCRDFRRQESLDDESPVVAQDADSARWAYYEEVLGSIRSYLSDEDRQVIEMWLAGQGWRCIGARFGLGVDAVRKRFKRSLAIVREMLATQDSQWRRIAGDDE